MSAHSNGGRVLVTGGTGFIGRHLVKALRASSEDVIVAGRPDDVMATDPSAAMPIDVDLAQPGRAAALVAETRPETVFHLAGLLGRGAPAVAAVECARLNALATVELLGAAMAAGVERIVVVGSAEEYGDQPGPLHEDLPLRPVTPYGASRAAATLFALALARSGCPVTVLRLFSVYGPGQPAQMFVAEAVACAVSGEAFRMTEGCQRRDLVYVEDVVAALLATAARPEAVGQVVNVGSGVPQALRDVAAEIWRLSTAAGPLLIGDRPASPGQLHDTWADIGRARRLLGWEPRVGLEEGLRATIAWARARATGAPCPA